MINGKKVIGVCMTKVQDPPRTRTISYLHKQLDKLGYKLMIFNSSFDFRAGIDEGLGAGQIYDFIQFDIVDALVIFCTGFLDASVYERIAKRAIAHNIPVILEDAQLEGCFTIRNEFEESLVALFQHVIHEHDARDTFFIAGIKGNPFSEERIAIYKKVLKDNGIEFQDDMLDYGDFWDGPTQKVMDRLLARPKLPRAIFCANDAMAMTVCNRLIEAGFKVPEDVIVTGFDGSRWSQFFEPMISTCANNRKGFVSKCIEVLTDAFEEKKLPRIHKNSYSLRLATSCGCTYEDRDDLNYKGIAESYYRMLTGMVGHEHTTYNDIILQMNAHGLEINAFYAAVSKMLGPNSCVALKPTFLTNLFLTTGEESRVDKLILIQSDYNQYATTDGKQIYAHFDYNDMVPKLEEWAEEHSAYVISSVQVGKTECGFFEAKTDDILREAQSINRVLNLINIIMHIEISDLRKRISTVSGNKENHMDTLTHLANLRGALYWYKDFFGEQKGNHNVATVSVYEIPKYKYIYDTYGIEETDAVVCFVAESLKIANPNNAFLARISEDTFIVINHYREASEISAVIQSATSIFYEIMENYNRTNGKEYIVEVHAGCAETTHAGEEYLESLIQEATITLYQNKVEYGTGNALKDTIKTSREQYDLFKTLLAKNSFQYHFQPIIKATTGEIYAYEALMRTPSYIGLNPMEVLSIAGEYNRLYDIEKATMFNVMKRYKDDLEAFMERKVFINCIPGYSLREEDNDKVSAKYSDLISNFVFEITEQDTVTNKELQVIRSIGNAKGDNPVAIDDYGTGHSNIVNLINYAPEIVKVDRFLITGIEADTSKQLLVQSTIAFAKLHDIKVLAEGVETEAELRKVIELGVDYIQGYYTGRPQYEPIEEIDAGIVAIIKEEADKRNN